jgi:hypothetical protein
MWFMVQRGADFFKGDAGMALRETPTVGLPGGTTISPGAIHLVNGVPTVVPAGQATIGGWAAAIGGAPVITACDSVGRTHGAFLPSNSPFNMNRTGGKGLSIFEE